MESKIAALINLKNHPVAVLQDNTLPDHAIQFKEGRKGCVIALLSAASKGKITAACRETANCQGGKVGLGFQPFQLGEIEYFLSVGRKGGRSGEFYKESPKYAREYCTALPRIHAMPYVVFKPLDLTETSETPKAVIFLVNADQLSALVTLANYDRSAQNHVHLEFGAGCAQSILYALSAEENEKDFCYIGLTDPSARKYIQKELLSFSIPYHRFLEMETKASDSFLTKETWARLSERLK